MAIKDIFTIIDIYDENLPGPRAALALAARTDAHVTGVAVAMEPLAPGFLASPIPADYIVTAMEETERNANAAAERFRALATAFGVAAEARTATVLAGATQPLIGQAFLSDLVVIGQENFDQPEPMRGALIEALLFDAGVPLLVVPFGWKKAMPVERVVIAWDGSATAARAVHGAMPILELAKSVEITIVATNKAWMGEPGADVATYLARHGLNVTINTVNRDVGDIAGTLASYLKASGADLCVMGAYGHSRIREFIVGGPTRDMLETMPIPVLMMH